MCMDVRCDAVVCVSTLPFLMSFVNQPSFNVTSRSRDCFPLSSNDVELAHVRH